MRIILPIFAIMLTGSVSAQPNCNIYKMDNDLACYEACNKATEAETYQGTMESQRAFDEAIRLCPKLDYAYIEKSVPYLKRGDFVTWKKIIDQGVEINPRRNLGYRAWCRYQFIRDYQGAIKDFELLEKLNGSNLGYSQNGDYHLTIVKGLCYRGIGDNIRARAIIKAQLSVTNYSPMPFDYLHLGIIEFDLKNFDAAIENFQKSIAHSDYLADPYYYLALICKRQNSPTESKANMLKAKAYYSKGYVRKDSYTTPMDKVFLSDIEAHLVSSK